MFVSACEDKELVVAPTALTRIAPVAVSGLSKGRLRPVPLRMNPNPVSTFAGSFIQPGAACFVDCYTRANSQSAPSIFAFASSHN
jgi:hypothetical protein